MRKNRPRLTPPCTTAFWWLFGLVQGINYIEWNSARGFVDHAQERLLIKYMLSTREPFILNQKSVRKFERLIFYSLRNLLLFPYSHVHYTSILLFSIYIVNPNSSLFALVFSPAWIEKLMAWWTAGKKKQNKTAPNEEIIRSSAPIK